MACTTGGDPEDGLPEGPEEPWWGKNGQSDGGPDMFGWIKKICFEKHVVLQTNVCQQLAVAFLCTYGEETSQFLNAMCLLGQGCG